MNPGSLLGKWARICDGKKNRRVGSAVLILSVNTSLDRVLDVRDLRLGEVNRAHREAWVGGGKALNVLRVLHALGNTSKAVVAVGGETGDAVRRLLLEEGLAGQCDFFSTRGASRICDVVLSAGQGRPTVINAEGPDLSESEVGRLSSYFLQQSRSKTDYIVLTGSLPPSVPGTFYADIIRETQAAGQRCMIDASGEALHQALGEAPWLVKINLEEFMGVAQKLEKRYTTRGNWGHSVWYRRIQPLCEAVACSGTRIIVTNGSAGSAAWTGDGAWLSTPPAVRAVNPIGSGDAFLAGLSAACTENQSFSRALVWATACATSNALHKMPQIGDISELRALAQQTGHTQLEQEMA